jgi:hypothetical protein
MIKGYAQAYLYLTDETYLVQAEKSMAHLLSWSVEGTQIFRILKNDKKSILGFADDYACLIDALICLFEASGNEDYLWKAQELTNHCLEHFYDKKSGLFFFTAHSQKAIVTKKIDINDDVIPSSNSILAKCLYRLAYYFENNLYEEIQEKMVQSIAEKMNKFPNGFSNWMQLIAWKEKGFTQVIIRGEEAKIWKERLEKTFNYQTLIHELKSESKIPLFQGKAISTNNTTAWVCKGKTCGLPLHQLKQVILELSHK